MRIPGYLRLTRFPVPRRCAPRLCCRLCPPSTSRVFLTPHIVTQRRRQRWKHKHLHHMQIKPRSPAQPRCCIPSTRQGALEPSYRTRGCLANKLCLPLLCLISLEQQRSAASNLRVSPCTTQHALQQGSPCARAQAHPLRRRQMHNSRLLTPCELGTLC